MITEYYKDIPAFYAPSQQDWRQWLMDHHEALPNVWLIIYRKDSGVPSVTYDQAVDEALCFGWIDSKPNKRDAQSRYQFFSQRKPRSNWSGINKAKVERLHAEGKIMPAGQRMIDLAKASGTWHALDEVTALVIPPDLQSELDADPQARDHFMAFPPSTRRGILEWIMQAKKPETRAKRIRETVTLAHDNIRANQYTPK